MAFVIGHPLPDPYHSYIRDSTIATHYHRVCTGCSNRYVTIEVPLTENWIGSKAECCPVHLKPGSVVSQISIERAKSGAYESAALMKILSLGGVYRRRECRVCVSCEHTAPWHSPPGTRRPGKVWVPCRKGARAVEGRPGCGCDEFSPCCHGNKRTRWTTGEFSADSVVVADVTKCPQCGGAAPIQRRSLAQLRARGSSARYQKAKQERLATARSPQAGLQ